MSLKQIAIAIDQLANALFGGWADETLSSRCWRKGWQTRVRLLDLIFGEGHCKESYESEQKRFHLPPEFRV